MGFVLRLDREILGPPPFAKRFQSLFGIQHRGGLIKIPQIADDLATVGIGDVLQRGSNQRHDAQLDVGLGERRLNRFREAGEAVDTATPLVMVLTAVFLR